MDDAMKAISSHRGDAIVIASQSSRVPWMQASTRPELDVPFAGAMSKESSVALGIALARPDTKIIVLSGDGELLMNLGTLVTIASQSPANLYHFVLDNRVYATTGGQPVPGAGSASLVGMAQAAGYPATYEFYEAGGLSRSIKGILDLKGPVFVCLHVEAQIRQCPSGQRQRPWKPLREYLHSLREMLARKTG
jgi:thiamine pyrophosphate-dependent acetolactate synthase large subunit-like protein